MQDDQFLYGVNLGGWLVLEKWMTPSIFAGTTATNEYELSQTAGGQARIRAHHASFLVEADFAWLKAQGVNAVRIPFGYWIFGNDTFYVGAIERLDWAVAMAKKYEMRVLLDVHGAPGAQNEADHSGSGRPKTVQWLKTPAFHEQTIQLLEAIALRYYDEAHVWGIELLNEPTLDWSTLRLVRFYRRAYGRLVKVARPGTVVVFGDGFVPLLLSGALRAKHNFPVVMDSHFYQCFSSRDKARTPVRHLKKTRVVRRLQLAFLQLQQPVIVGEWSGVLPHETFGSLDKAAQIELRNEYLRVQHAAYQQAAGWFYWSYKTERDDDWNFRYLVESGNLSVR